MSEHVTFYKQLKQRGGLSNLGNECGGKCAGSGVEMINRAEENVRGICGGKVFGSFKC
jgi:hypothetical protein